MLLLSVMLDNTKWWHVAMQNLISLKAMLLLEGLGTMGFALPAAIGAKMGTTKYEKLLP